MADRTEYFSRVAGRVDVGELTDAFVVMVGVGSVGSLLALELARCGVGHMVLVDGDALETVNLPRHALPEYFVGTNKAEAMAEYLELNVPGLDVGGARCHLDDSFSDHEIDRFLMAADLIVVATDQRDAQRRIARRALAMDIPALVPGLYADRGGEVFVQLNPAQGCFMCWDGFRDPDSEVRGVSSVNADSFGIIQQALYLSIALLEPGSRHIREMAPSRDDRRPRQLFVLRPGAAMLRAPVTRRPGCPGCAVGPSSLNGEASAGSPAALVRELLLGRGRPRAAGWPFLLSGAHQPPEAPEITLVQISTPLPIEGEAVTLSWNTQNATHVVIDGHGVFPAEGELTTILADTGHFRLHAENPFGSGRETISDPVHVVPIPRLKEHRVLGFPTITAPLTPAGWATSLADPGDRKQETELRPIGPMPRLPSPPGMFISLPPLPAGIRQSSWPTLGGARR